MYHHNGDILPKKGNSEMAKVTTENLPGLVNRIVEKFEPDRIILFGSRAYGNSGDDSDFDLLIIMPYEGRDTRVALDILRATEHPFPVDILVKNPEEAEKSYEEYDPFIRSAFDYGKILYERHDKKMVS